MADRGIRQSEAHGAALLGAVAERHLLGSIPFRSGAGRLCTPWQDIIGPNRIRAVTVRRNPESANSRKKFYGLHSILCQLAPETTFQFQGRASFAFPNNQDLPTQLPQLANLSLVSQLVCDEFRRPEIEVRTRRRGFLASCVPMPEASVNENRSLAAGQDQVRRSGKPSAMQPIPETERTNQLPNRHLRLGVLRPDKRISLLRSNGESLSKQEPSVVSHQHDTISVRNRQST